jgi:hypothetical protein
MSVAKLLLPPRRVIVVEGEGRGNGDVGVGGGGLVGLGKLHLNRGDDRAGLMADVLSVKNDRGGDIGEGGNKNTVVSMLTHLEFSGNDIGHVGQLALLRLVNDVSSIPTPS